MVSDFYTPQYFDPVKSSGVRYSFSGRCAARARCWMADICRGSIRRPATCFNCRLTERKRTIANRGEVPFDVESLRAFSDSVSTDRRDAVITAVRGSDCG